MIHRQRMPLTFALLGALGAAASTSAVPPDGDSVRLAERLAALPAAQSSDGRVSASGLAAPRVLFTHQGDDNACALLLRPDANADGIPEAVIGWELFKSGDNLETLSGDGYDTGRVLWSLVTADGISGGYFSDIDQLADFPDATGDGISELLTGTSGGGRAATLYDGASGQVLQSFDTYLGADSGWVYDVQVMGDVNGNGTIDFALAVGSDADSVFMVDGGETGNHHDELWQFEAADAFFTLARLGDVDGDGIDDLAAGAGDNLDVVFALSGATGDELWQTPMRGSVYDLAVYPDRNGDGIDEVVVGSWSSSSGVALLDGAGGGPIWESGAVGTFVMRVVAYDDVDGDGWPEIAVASWANSAFSLSGRTGSAAWESPSDGDVWAIDRVADVTGDGISEIAFGSFDGFAYLADGSNGAPLWAHPADGRKVLALRAGGDADGDGAPEVLIGAQQLDAGSAILAWVVSADSGVPAAGPELTLTGTPAIGATVTAEVTGARPGATIVWLRGDSATLEPAPPPVSGWLAVTPPRLLGLSTADAGGRAEVDLTIPDDPELVGRELFVQTVEASDGASRTLNRVGFAVIDGR